MKASIRSRNSGFRFTNFDGAGGYIYNLKTTGLLTGAYTLLFKAGNEPFIYAVPFQIR